MIIIIPIIHITIPEYNRPNLRSYVERIAVMQCNTENTVLLQECEHKSIV